MLLAHGDAGLSSSPASSCYVRQPARVDHRPVARAGVGRLSDAVAGLRHQRGRRVLPVRRIGHADALARHRLHHRRACGWSRAADADGRQARPRCKFAAPARSTRRRSPASPTCCAPGWITSGPWVEGVRGRDLSAFCGGRPVRVVTSATAAMETRAAALRHRPRRRGDHVRPELLHRAQHDREGRRHAGVRRLRPRHAQHRPRCGRRRASARARARSCRRTGPGSLVRHGRPLRARDEAQAARHRGCRAGHRLVVARQAHRRFGDSGHVQLPSEQEHHVDRGRRAGRERRSRGDARSRCCASTASSACPTARATSPSPAASSTCRTSTRASAWRNSRSCRNSSRQRRALVERYFERFAHRSRVRSCRTAATPATDGHSLEHVPRAAAAGAAEHHAQAVSRRAGRRAASAPACRTRRCTCPRSAGASAIIAATCPHTERIADTTVTLPLHPAMTTPTSIACAPPARRSCAAARA